MAQLKIRVVGDLERWQDLSDAQLNTRAMALIHEAAQTGQWRSMISDMLCIERVLLEREGVRGKTL